MRFPAIPTSVLAIPVACVLIGSVSSALGQECPPEITDPAPLNSNADFDTRSDRDPQVTTDGVGNWVAVWMSHEFLGGPFGDDDDIFFSRSTDTGASWTDPAPLNTNAVFDSGNDESPQIATDGAGNWVAVWSSDDNLGGEEGGIGEDFDILFARSTDDGASWSDPQPLNTNATFDFGSDQDPQLSTDEAGNWLAVWSSDDALGEAIGEDEDILFARSTDNGVTWSAPSPLNTNAAFDSGDDDSPQLRTDGAGHWVGVWTSRDDLGGTIGTDGDILFARSADNGVNWSAPAPLSANAASDDSLIDGGAQLTTDGVGIWVALWWSRDDLGETIGHDGDILFVRSTDNGAIWSGPAALNTNAADDRGRADLHPQIATDGDGTWVALWQVGGSSGGPLGEDRDILVSRSIDSGLAWTDPQPLNTNATFDEGWDSDPSLATDGMGAWLGVWRSSDDLGGTIGYDWDILLARFQLGDHQDITLCHVPPGNSDNAHTIIVNENAVPAHLAHGDSCGPCEEDDGVPPDDGDDGETEASACPADVDGDGAVNASDLAELLAAWGVCPAGANCPADLDADGGVGATDLSILLNNWNSCP